MRDSFSRKAPFFQMASDALLFPDPPLESLQTLQAGFALRQGSALKFAREVIPFAAVTQNTPSAMADLHALMASGESAFLVSYATPATAPGLICKGPQGVMQIEWPALAAIPLQPETLAIEPLTCDKAAEMVALTDAAFPGFFRARTCELGPYYGIRDPQADKRLVAMCGERMNIQKDGQTFRELSGLCTLPAYRGRGYAAVLMARLLHGHRAQGHRSYLHVSSHNTGAIALYERMGFLNRGEFSLYTVTRAD